MFQPTKLAVLMIGLVVASPWMLAQSTPAAPTPLPPAEKVESPTAAADPNGAPQPVDPRSFEIGAEDVLKILVWQSQEFSGLHVVRPDGKITLPLVGDVQAEGLTPNRLTATLTEALKTYLESPNVTVSVQQVNSKSYWVAGYVNRPSEYPLITPIRVYQAIVAAGGFREFAKTKEVIIMRGNQRLKFNADDYRKGKNLDKNIFVENGDLIEVFD